MCARHQLSLKVNRLPRSNDFVSIFSIFPLFKYLFTEECFEMAKICKKCQLSFFFASFPLPFLLWYITLGGLQSIYNQKRKMKKKLQFKHPSSYISYLFTIFLTWTYAALHSSYVMHGLVAFVVETRTTVALLVWFMLLFFTLFFPEINSTLSISSFVNRAVDLSGFSCTHFKSFGFVYC